MKRRLSLAILLTAWAGPALGSTESSPTRLLLHVHANISVGGFHGAPIEEDLFLDTSGQVTSIVARQTRWPTGPDRWVVTRSSPVATRDLYGAFVRRLRANDIGSQVGGCVVGAPLLLTEGTLELTWYEGQRVVIEASLGETNTCPPELLRIIREIGSFANAVGASGFGFPL